MAARRQSKPPADPGPSDPPSAPSDQELLQRYLDGDRQAFEALVTRYRQPLFAFLARFTGNRDLAEDVFQDSFLQLHMSAATFDLSRRLKPWLYTIAANKARDALRKRSRRQMASLDQTISGQADEAAYADLMPADIPLPEETAVNLELRQAVEQIVREMPENLREALMLSYFDDLSYKEIAEVVDAPLGTVKSRLHTAVKMFAARWQAVARRLGYGQEP